METGIDGIPTKFLKNLSKDLHNLLYKIIIKSYVTGDFSKNFSKA